MTTNENESPATPLPAAPTKGFALYDLAELRYLDGIFPTAAKAREAHKDHMVKGRKYEAREV